MMTRWKKAPDETDFDDDEMYDFEGYFNESDDIDLESFIDITTPDIEKIQRRISDSTSTGPPFEYEDQQIKDIPSQIPQQRIVEFQDIDKSNRPPRTNVEPRFKISLTKNEISFREDFYSIFLNNIKGKRIIPKEKVVLIHNSIYKQAGVRKMRRDEYRIINNYFKHFAKYKDAILSCIIQNKESLSILIDLPTIIERANSNLEARKNKNKKINQF